MYNLTADEVVDLELQFITGKTVMVDNVPIRPVPISQIAESYSEYCKLLNIIALDKYQLRKIFQTEDIDDSQVLPFILMMVLSARADGSESTDFDEAFEYFTGEKPEFQFEEGRIKIGEGYLTADNYEKFQMIVKIRNGVNKLEEKQAAPDDERMRRLLERREELRRKVAEAKRKQGDNEINLSDLIGILAAGLGVPIGEVERYDMWQFNDQFGRLRVNRDYDTGVQALVHGASSDDVKLEHWISKLHTKDD